MSWKTYFLASPEEERTEVVMAARKQTPPKNKTPPPPKKQTTPAGSVIPSEVNDDHLCGFSCYSVWGHHVLLPYEIFSHIPITWCPVGWDGFEVWGDGMKWQWWRWAVAKNWGCFDNLVSPKEADWSLSAYKFHYKGGSGFFSAVCIRPS